MLVRLPLRSSTTCDALLVSLASFPATKKPQNALATDGANSPANRAIVRIRSPFICGAVAAGP